MARTKARRRTSTGGRLPRMQLATRAAVKTAPAYLSPSNSEDSGSCTKDYLYEEHTGSPGSKFRRDHDLNFAEVDSGARSGERRQSLYTNLLNALCSPSHERYGTFASCEAVKYSPQGLMLESFHVEGAGEFQLPLLVHDVLKLRSVCEQASFGQCWQVDASKVIFPGAPDFIASTIQPLAVNAVRNLARGHGAAVQLDAHLDKLILCETDDHFTFQRNTESEPGLFATLVLQIPTQDGYEGGGFVVQHKDSSRTFDCHLVSSVGFCHIVFFADCKHQLQKVTSGTRLCLSFNLVSHDSSMQAWHRELVSLKVLEAKVALQPWLSDVINGNHNNTYSPKLAIPLTHEYRKEDISFDGLKGDDSIVLEVLKNCRDENGKQLLDLHLCLVTSHCEGDVDLPEHSDSDHYSYSDESLHLDDDDRILRMDEKIKIELWVGEEEKFAMGYGKLGLDKREIVVGDGQRAFHAEPHEKKFKRRKSDPGPMWEAWCHRVMLIVWPKELSVSLFCETRVSYALDVLKLTFKVGDPEFCEHLRRILCWCENNVFKVWREPSDFDAVTPQLLQLCTSARELEGVLQLVFKLLAKTFLHNPGNYWGGDYDKKKLVAFQVGVRNKIVAKEIATVVQVYGWSPLSTSIMDLVKQCALSQGRSFARLAKELFLIGEKDAGSSVGDAAIEAFEARITELEQHTEPVFTWCQPEAKLSSRPVVENFLRGPHESFVLRGFESFETAKKFAEKYFQHGSFRDGYSATASAGHGRNEPGAFCKIHKNRATFERGMKQWQQVRGELFSLKHELGRIKATVNQAEEAAAVDPTLNATDRHHKKRKRSNFVEDIVHLSSGSED